MSIIHTTTHTGPDGVLKIELPIGIPDADLDVTLQYEPTEPKLPMTREEWLRFIDATAGKWQGEPLRRPEQGILEHRDTWG